MSERMIVSSEGTHWYKANGEPCHTVQAKSGADRDTTLADAKKMNLLPSYSTMSKIMDKPALKNWIREQDIMAALTTPHIEGETEQDFIKRVIESAGDESQKARERGSNWHTLIAGYILTGNTNQFKDENTYLGTWLIDNVLTADKQKPFPLVEQSLASPELGYAATIDYFGQFIKPPYDDGKCLVDWKTCKTVKDKPIKPWEDWNYQMAAYMRLLLSFGNTFQHVLNVAISTTEDRIEIFEWSKEDLDYGYSVFDAIHKLYRIKNKFPLGN